MHVDQSRFLGADQAHHRSQPPTICALLAAHDSDPFNRWQALQTISMRAAGRQCRRRRVHGQPPRSGRQADEALAAILEDATLEPAFIALALGTTRRRRYRPRDRPRYRPRRNLLRPRRIAGAIGERLGPAAYRAFIDKMAVRRRLFSPDAASAGRRSLRNVALDLLAATGKSAGTIAARLGNMTQPTT